MKKVLFAILTAWLILGSQLRADEGMWLPLLMTSQDYDAMRARGFRMTPEDLYSVNQASLKDAIVLFGRGCTAGLVSGQGLLLTNHHCGYSRIQSHSSVATDYLTNGFWAMSSEEELSNPGLTASILVRMEDVTRQVTGKLNSSMPEKERNEAIRKESAAIAAKAVEGTRYEAEVKPFYYGNQFILIVMEVFRDVRLVGAPPSAIGKFGGDTDNWMWPRHTGDFSIFRIYADKDNQPAEYSSSNVPYKPKKFLEISAQGVKEGDFTMVYGFPYQTEEYLPSYAIDLYQHHIYPITVSVRDRELEVINGAMATSPELRIMYAARQAGVANAWKKYLGVIPGLERFHVLERKQNEEQKILKTLEGDPLEQDRYHAILKAYAQAYQELQPLETWDTYFSECFWKEPFFRFIFRAYPLPSADPETETGLQGRDKVLTGIRKAIPGFYQSVDIQTEQKLFAAMVKLFSENIPVENQPGALQQGLKKYHGDYAKFAGKLFHESLFASEEKATRFFNSWKASSAKKLQKDPLFLFMKELVDYYRNEYHPKLIAANQALDSLHRQQMQVIMEVRKGSRIYPDANASLRISYGQVRGSFPRDGVRYKYQTTLDGIFAKEDPDIEDYTVPARLKEIGIPSMYGNYGSNGTMPVAFLATNHTTGGNSGSPVLDASGRLIGLNFDRAWEGTMSDLCYEPSICRNITLDIRYLLFIVDQYAGATRLIDEMVISR